VCWHAYVDNWVNLRGENMGLLNRKAYFAAVFCLPLLLSFTHAETDSNEPNGVATTKDILTKSAEQKRSLWKQEQTEIRKVRQIKAKWNQLKSGMTEKQVQAILGKPKLIQGGSHECIWFYQDLPISNGMQVKDGIVVFRSRSIACLDEAEQRSEFLQNLSKGSVVSLIEEECIALQYEIPSALLYPSPDPVVRELRELPKNKYSTRPQLSHQLCQGSGGCLIRDEEEKRDKAVEKEKVKCEKAIAKQLEKRRNNLEAQRNNDAILDDLEQRQMTIREIERRYEATVKREYKKYYKRLKILRRNPRFPIFALKLFNQPDWERFNELSIKQKPSRTKVEKPIDKWKEPKRWRKLLKINMKPVQVVAILGEPEKTETDVDGTTFYYANISGYGELVFSAESDLGDHLNSWTEPFWPAIEDSLKVETEIISETHKVNP
jgi:outer membrane protein assembly factor BamE (lipoprotein component of BamABCDE complex)